MSNSVKNLLIGLFLLAGLGVFVGFILFLRPSVGDQKQTLYVRFSTINKVNIGTRVLFAGKAVGEVAQINEIYHARETQPSDQLGRLYFYQLTLKLDSSVHVYSTDEISIQTSGLMGEKSIAIVPKTPAKGTIPEMITDKTPFYADSIDPLENTFNKLSSIGDKLDDTIGMVKTWFEQNGDHLSIAVSSFGSAMTQIDTATKTLNEEQLIPQLKKGASAITASMQKVDDALDSMTRSKVFENFGPIMENLKTATTSFDTVCQDLATAQGTIGKLIKGDDFYLRATALLSKADTMMNDINHYGILFHLNKGWQRTRTKQMSAMSALSTPSSFKTYFETEVDQINTAMARISMLVDKAEPSILDTPQFRENFAELMRKVKEMSDNLHLYNEKLAEAIDK